uniref:PPM-type phosphatase domain-containing protein n=1 Tax=Chromera velia CCMP2878 TaxID=1169474 RepID=A0A0G4GTQ0_9ALVE|eukprot:Cvel_23278.t1-p1 / transcript=Cvel_23278.t1 / gene=Cvel_23278 / organism=Chromera_velia_CCMP2878 / gene_product=hypothetical protein / transcript_product=hypothetical protein / location=Cvel_scaffold2381:4640-13405(-) / protein_length=1457 / sequence_SO=supercontig / SO=protein_coding / is_pseudo=false
MLAVNVFALASSVLFATSQLDPSPVAQSNWSKLFAVHSDDALRPWAVGVFDGHGKFGHNAANATGRAFREGLACLEKGLVSEVGGGTEEVPWRRGPGGGASGVPPLPPHPMVSSHSAAAAETAQGGGFVDSDAECLCCCHCPERLSMCNLQDSEEGTDTMNTARHKEQHERELLALRLRSALHSSFQSAQKAVHLQNEQHEKDFGTTATVAFLHDGVLMVLQCGDSSAFFVPCRDENEQKQAEGRGGCETRRGGEKGEGGAAAAAAASAVRTGPSRSGRQAGGERGRRGLALSLAPSGPRPTSPPPHEPEDSAGRAGKASLSAPSLCRRLPAPPKPAALPEHPHGIALSLEDDTGVGGMKGDLFGGTRLMSVHRHGGAAAKPPGRPEASAASGPVFHFSEVRCPQEKGRDGAGDSRLTFPPPRPNLSSHRPGQPPLRYGQIPVRPKPKEGPVFPCFKREEGKGQQEEEDEEQKENRRQRGFAGDKRKAGQRGDRESASSSAPVDPSRLRLLRQGVGGVGGGRLAGGIAGGAVSRGHYPRRVGGHWHECVTLTVAHNGFLRRERKRVEQGGVGRFCFYGDKVCRLEPRHMSEQGARASGLSISMTRALGHKDLSRYGLLCVPDFSLMDLRLPFVSKTPSPNPFNAGGEKEKSQEERGERRRLQSLCRQLHDHPLPSCRCTREAHLPSGPNGEQKGNAPATAVAHGREKKEQTMDAAPTRKKSKQTGKQQKQHEGTLLTPKDLQTAPPLPAPRCPDPVVPLSLQECGCRNRDVGPFGTFSCCALALPTSFCDTRQPSPSDASTGSASSSQTVQESPPQPEGETGGAVASAAAATKGKQRGGAEGKTKKKKGATESPSPEEEKGTQRGDKKTEKTLKRRETERGGVGDNEIKGKGSLSKEKKKQKSRKSRVDGSQSAATDGKDKKEREGGEKRSHGSPERPLESNPRHQKKQKGEEPENPAACPPAQSEKVVKNSKRPRKHGSVPDAENLSGSSAKAHSQTHTHTTQPPAPTEVVSKADGERPAKRTKCSKTAAALCEGQKEKEKECEKGVGKVSLLSQDPSNGFPQECVVARVESMSIAARLRLCGRRRGAPTLPLSSLVPPDPLSSLLPSRRGGRKRGRNDGGVTGSPEKPSVTESAIKASTSGGGAAGEEPEPKERQTSTTAPPQERERGRSSLAEASKSSSSIPSNLLGGPLGVGGGAGGPFLASFGGEGRGVSEGVSVEAPPGGVSDPRRVCRCCGGVRKQVTQRILEERQREIQVENGTGVGGQPGSGGCGDTSLVARLPDATRGAEEERGKKREGRRVPRFHGWLVVCSDGVTDVFSPNEIAGFLALSDGSAAQAYLRQLQAEAEATAPSPAASRTADTEEPETAPQSAEKRGEGEVQRGRKEASATAERVAERTAKTNLRANVPPGLGVPPADPGKNVQMACDRLTAEAIARRKVGQQRGDNCTVVIARIFS